MELAVPIGLPAKGCLSSQSAKGGLSSKSAKGGLSSHSAKGGLSSHSAKGGLSSQRDGMKIAPGKRSAARGKRLALSPRPVRAV